MQFHTKIPRERTENLKMRLRVLKKCREKAKYRRAVMSACKDDLLFFVNLFVFQFNVVRQEHVRPLALARDRAADA